MAAAYQDIHREIIELSKTGNPKAQFQLYKLYSKAMFNICVRMLNSIEEAEDLLQESFTDAFMKLNSFRYESSFGAWLKRIVINKCINTINKKKVDLVFQDQPVEQDTRDEEVDYRGIDMDVQRIHHAVGKLPDGYRVIFSLYALEGYDHGEISQIMNISESTSKSQYLRAKQKIKELLKNNDDERQVRTIHQ
ncbi:MAG: sigma-70 family RNA polymerase sigma factor [Bacteroidales bacterium]|nr:sigma-70 family RNA polymerase sigma factor [Bacteroidales bacterium]